MKSVSPKLIGRPRPLSYRERSLIEVNVWRGFIPSFLVWLCELFTLLSLGVCDMFFAKLETLVLNVVSVECVVNIPKLLRLIGKKMKMVGPEELKFVIDKMVERGTLATIASVEDITYYAITEDGSEEVYRRKEARRAKKTSFSQ